MTGLRYCVMQPYFFPHASYYRLFFDADIFVIFDNAQFPRRGRVHRCQLADRSGHLRWLTVPLVASKQATPISEMHLRDGVGSDLMDRLLANEDVASVLGRVERLKEALTFDSTSLVDFLSRQLEVVSEALGNPCRFLLASDILTRGPEDYQDYIIDIGRILNARSYVNLPGGRALYDPNRFERAGLAVDFLPLVPAGTSILQTWDESLLSLKSIRMRSS